MALTQRPRVRVMSLGGTMAMTSGGAATGSGATPSVDAAGLVAAVPELTAHATVDTEELSRVPSASLRTADLLGHVGRLQERCAEGARGLVLTTGTDTLEEVAYLLDLFWSRDEPLVVTGAMRTADAVGSDGPANLLAAVAVAASPIARGHGCLTVLDEQVHSARAVRKTHTTRLAAFTSAGGAPLGRFQEGRVQLDRALPRPPALPLPTSGARVPRVALLRLGLDDDATLLEHAAATCDGVVVEAFGAGHVPDWWVDPLRRAAARIPVAVASRTGAGALLRRSYGFAGSERDLVEAGLDFVDDMDGIKARILLVGALMTTADRRELSDLMFTRGSAGTTLVDAAQVEGGVA